MVTLYQNEIKNIELQLNNGLKDVSENDTHRIFQVHKMAFNELMTIVKVYQPLLKDIKQEYESLISHVIKAQKYSEKMENEIRIAATYPTTIANHERYCSDLREKLQKLRKVNNHRLEKIRDVQTKSIVVSKMIDKKQNDSGEERIKIRRDIRRLPNMNLTDLTDLTTMQNLCSELENQVHQLKHTQSTKYVVKEEEIKLSSQLMDQIIKHDQLRIDVKSRINQKVMLQTALNQAISFSRNRHIHQSIGEVIVRALVSGANVNQIRPVDSVNISIEDEIDTFYPESNRRIGSSKGSEYIVLCIRAFERLFNEAKYKEAADLAVVAPKGVLRNYSTMIKFKKIPDGHHLLYYCQQLINTMKKSQLDADMSYECVDSALKEGRIDLVNLWISQNKIESTELIADNLTSHADLMPDNKIACLDLATKIYWDLMSNLANETDTTVQHSNPQWVAARGKYFDSILECHIKSGRIEEVIDMLTNENSSPVSSRSRQEMYKTNDFLLLIKFYPNIELVQNFVSKGFIPFPSALKSLLENGSYGVAAEIMLKNLSAIGISEMTQQLIVGIPNGITSEEWEEMLNFVNESDEKIIIEIAASYLVQISIEKSFLSLQDYELTD